MFICLALSNQVYYGLTNFFQNHRSYVKSRDDSQLLGDVGKKPSDDCKPFQDEAGKPYIPCGAIANSLFSGKSLGLKPIELQAAISDSVQSHR